MSDVKLHHFGKRRDCLSGRKIETVPGMHFQPSAVCESGTANDAIELGRRRLPARDRIAPGSGMDLDDRRADLDRGLDLRRLGGDEQRNPYAGIGQFSDYATQRVLVCGSVETSFGRSLLAANWPMPAYGFRCSSPPSRRK